MNNDIESTREHTKIVDKRAINQQADAKSRLASPLLGTVRSIMITLVSLWLAMMIVIGAYYVLKHNYFDPVDKNDTTPIRVEIPLGSSLSSISDVLYEKGIIRNTAVFKLYVDFNDMSSKMQAGTYDLNKTMTMDDVIAILGNGTTNISVTSFTVTEGMTVNDMANMFVDAGILDDKTDFLEICETGVGVDSLEFLSSDTDVDETAQAAASGQTHVKFMLEGYLFPDTYEIFINSAPETIVNKMLNRFQEVFTSDYITRADEIGMSISEVVTLASIIEREGKPQDFKKISAVFHNRLKKDDKLQSCATLQYVTGIKKLQFDQTEMDTTSPYNTYLNAGLPVGPISNPGKQAIEAALYPDEDYLAEGYYFFCSKDPESGELAFAKTYAEHQANVAKYEDLWAAYDASQGN